jgi:hypothetical protein
VIYSSPILAAAFVSPGFLAAGLLLAALPVIIHILNRRRYKIVNWAAMEYLLAAMKKNRRRLKFEQWILLATRCLLLALLGVALARPLGCTDNKLSALAAERTGLHVFIIDNSYSMAYEADRADTKTHLDQVKKIATAVVDRLSSGGESVAIFTAAAPAQAVVARATYDLDSARSAIARIDQTYAGTDLLSALQKAQQLATDESRQPIKKLYILSDSTRSAWDTPAASALKQLGVDLAKQYDVTYFNLGRKDQSNLATLDLRPTSNLVTSKFNNDFLAATKGFGATVASSLQWKLDDQTLPGVSTVKLALDTPPQIHSNVILKTGGPHVLSAALTTTDRLPADNSRLRVVDVAGELKTLIVEGDRGVGLLSGSAAFLDTALAPPKEAGAAGQGVKTDSYVSPDLISDLELSNKVLADYRAVILTNVAQLQPAQAEALEKFVRSGGLLMLFMGEQINSDNYNKTLLPRSLLPGALTRRMSAGADQKGFLLDFKSQGNLHPLLSIFRGEQKSGLDTAQIFTYYQIELQSDAKVERVLNYVGNNDPAITTHSLGAGRVLFISTTANADWTTLPVKLNYVTFIQELFSGSVRTADDWLNREVGQSLEIPPTTKTTGRPTLTDASKREVPIEESQTPDRQPIWRSRQLNRPGLYTLSTGERTYPVAVNIPSTESDIRTLEPAAIKSALGDIDLALEPDQPPAEFASDDPKRDFGWTFMLLVFGLVAIECFMAMEFGHHKRIGVKRT